MFGTKNIEDRLAIVEARVTALLSSQDTIYKLLNTLLTEKLPAKTSKKKTPRKKHLHKKICSVCGFAANGGVGLSAHVRRKHEKVDTTSH